MACLLRSTGATVSGDSDDEFDVFRPDNDFPYSLDICAVLGDVVYVVEIDGYQGHKSYRAIRKDQFRFREIQELIAGQVKCFRFSFWQLTPWNKETEALIKQEMNLPSPRPRRSQSQREHEK